MIPALDTDDLAEAVQWVDRLVGRVRVFKVGSQLFTRVGPRSVEVVLERGGAVFLDLKFHDIPNTVRAAARAAASLGVSWFNVHALGGPEMVRAAVQGAREEAQKTEAPPPKVLAVTILTSMDTARLNALGMGGTVKDCVSRLGAMAVEMGADGLVASPQEVGELRRTLGERILLVTPGIRMDRIPEADDQKRVMGPGEALRAGADYLVMGRSLLESGDPVGLLEGLKSP